MTTPTSFDLKARLVAILGEKFGLPEDEVLSGATFDELDIDSLVLVELSLILRKELGVDLAEGDLDSSFRIDDAVAAVEAKRAMV
ncbi:acyl carrier protein [Streptomyces mauvecolor]|uniref:Acyl carrier protein n=1 Tax=Streptomyces mauvecolor TaxID=58345 RepID=A0ABV9UJS7_9ACTN